MKKQPSTWDRINWNPLLPGLLLAWWIWRMNQRGWDWNWFQIICVIVFPLWFAGAVANFLTKGKVLEWMSSDDDSDFEIPDSFAEFEKQTDRSSPLIDALRRGLADGGNLEEELEKLDLEEIEKADEAVGALAAYRQLCRADDSRAADAMRLFRLAGSAEIFSLFYQQGMPLAHARLKAIAGRETDRPDFDSEELKLLEMLCGFGFAPAFPDIVRAARDPRIRGSYMWGSIFGAGNAGDDDFVDLLTSLGKELPADFACVAFLDRCNEMCLEHNMDPHPFSSDAGIARLREYLTDPDPEHFSYATSASTALPFLSHPGKEELFSIAAGHPDPNVEVETAWAGAKTGKREFIDQLAGFTADWKTGGRAMSFLHELDLENEIPEDSLDPPHVAKCDLADWLQHPNELGKLPDTLEIIDHRRIFWPPEKAARDVTILKWTSKEDSGVGMTGGTTTWCFFSRDECGEPPLDIYARHCNWQLRANDMAGAPDDYDDLEFGRGLLKEVNPGEDWSPRPV